MKSARFITLVAIGLILCFAATGCRTRPQGLTKLPGRKSQPEVKDEFGSSLPAPDQNFAGTPLPPEDLHKGWRENPDLFKANTVHFDLDSHVVKAGDRAHIAAVADYLKGNSADAVRVEGHCDERGTEGYNQSLGERRALAVREELIRLGIEPTRVDTISYGEARPADSGHDEAAWSKNRRSEFILLSPPITN